MVNTPSEQVIKQMRETMMARGRTGALVEVSTLLREGLREGWTLREVGERFVAQIARPNLQAGLNEVHRVVGELADAEKA